MAASSCVAIKVLLYFKQDLNEIFTKYNLDYTNEPSWVLEIIGLNEEQRNLILTKYDRLRCSKTGDWIIGESRLFDFEAGSVTQFHDVAPFFDTLINQLGFQNDTENPPSNSTGLEVNDVREWTFTKIN